MVGHLKKLELNNAHVYESLLALKWHGLTFNSLDKQ